jgi:adenylate cyclase
VERRLAAIMAADMVGYSRLMAADESGTILRHKFYRQAVIDPKVSHHGGRVFKATGDGFLVEFPSAVHAVQCAVEIQTAIAEHEKKGSHRQIQYRVGISLGDLVIDEGDIFGDGVNVAARLEQLADAGGVCISDVVYQNVKSKLSFAFESLGRKELKNIPGEVQVYRVQIGEAASGGASHQSAKDKPTLPGKPSIAVLPFVNMSNSRDHEFFADGMTEDIITALSRIRELFVISHNSSFVYKGRKVRIEDVAHELGVAFILEGSVRVAGNRVRVTAQLIDGHSGGHVWAENFDGNLDDIFAVQDEITRNIALAMQMKLTYGELARLWEGQTKNLRAWEKMAQGRDLFLKFNPIDNREARRVFQEALVIDPNYTGAMVQLGLSYWWEARFEGSADKDQCLRLAEQQVEKALGIDPGMGSAWMLRGGVAFLRDRHDEAVELCQKAVDLVPSDSWAAAFLGLVCVYAGQNERALMELKTAMRLSPYYPAWYAFLAAVAHAWLGNFAAAEEANEADLERTPHAPGPHTYVLVAMIRSFQGRDDEAARAVSDLREQHPAFGINDVILSERYKDRGKLDRVLDILRRGGLPG